MEYTWKKGDRVSVAALPGPVHRDRPRDTSKKKKKKKIKAYLAYDSWNANLNKLLERYNKVK